MHLVACEMPVNKVGNTVCEYPNRIWTTFNLRINKAYNAAEHSQVTQVGIDETSSKRGHNYIIVGIDLKGHNIFDAVAGKDVNIFSQIKDCLESWIQVANATSFFENFQSFGFISNNYDIQD